MRELTRAEAATIGGGKATAGQQFNGLCNQAFYKELRAEVRVQMAKVVKELQDSVRQDS